MSLQIHSYFAIPSRVVGGARVWRQNCTTLENPQWNGCSPSLPRPRLRVQRFANLSAALEDPLAYFGESLVSSEYERGLRHAVGTHVLCKMHSVSDRRYEYPVPDLLATSEIPGSDRRRWRYWPRYPP